MSPLLNHPLQHTMASLALLLAGAAQAGPLADPTRPPAALAAPGGLAAASLPHRANLDTARAIAAAARAAEPQAPATPALVQAVQIGANGRAQALVDGRPVKVGDLLEGRSVLAIDAQGLLVKGPRGPERLWLLAGAPKQLAGSITDSQTTRYQPATQADTERSPATDALASTSASARATQIPVSLAGRTTP